MKMIEVRVDEATNIQLDYLVAKAEGRRVDLDPFGRTEHTGLWVHSGNFGYWRLGGGYSPTDDWSRMGPIAMQAGIGYSAEGYPDNTVWVAQLARPALVRYLGDGPDGSKRYCTMRGPSPLIAMARCYVASLLGDVGEVPEELV